MQDSLSVSCFHFTANITGAGVQLVPRSSCMRISWFSQGVVLRSTSTSSHLTMTRVLATIPQGTAVAAPPRAVTLLLAAAPVAVVARPAATLLLVTELAAALLLAGTRLPAAAAAIAGRPVPNPPASSRDDPSAATGGCTA
jgi:hypothetical protein